MERKVVFNLVRRTDDHIGIQMVETAIMAAFSMPRSVAKTQLRFGFSPGLS